MKNKKEPLFPARFRLSGRGYLLLMLCLLIHILYNLFLFFCICTDKIDASAFRLESSAFLESQLLSLLVTVIGTLLLELEIKRQSNKD